MYNSFCSKSCIKEYIIAEKEKCKNICINFKGKGIQPTFAIIQVGDNPASNRYIKGKIIDCNEIGINVIYKKFTENISIDKFIDEVSLISIRTDIHGVIIQKPLPNHLENNWERIINLIPKEKDVDGFRNDSCFVPCTASGIMDYLLEFKKDITGNHCVIINRSELVGRPLVKEMLDNNATVTVCHSKTKNLKDITNKADILVTAIGKPKYIDKSYIKPNTIVIDVGINFDETGKMCGDVDYDDIMQITDYCTPVPGGVGLLTRLALIKNLLKAYEIIGDKI